MPARKRAPCKTMTPATQVSFGCSRARRCGWCAPAARGEAVQIAMARRPVRCAAPRHAILATTRSSASRSRSCSASSMRTERQGAPPLPQDSDALLGLAAYVGLQSRGLPVQITADGPALPFLEAGKTLFAARQGQLNLSCSQCHDGLAGQRLAGSVIPQGHSNGYPEYRLEWGRAMGSLDRRIRMPWRACAPSRSRRTSKN